MIFGENKKFMKNLNMLLTDFSTKLLNFLIETEQISSECEEEKWDVLYQKFNIWREQYLIKSEEINLYGVDGWYMDLYISEFLCPLEMWEKFDIYIYIMTLVSWMESFDDDDYRFYRNQNFAETLHSEFNFEDYSEERLFTLTKKNLIKELEERYTESYDRFCYYKTERNNNPVVVKKLEEQYPRFTEYIQYLKKTLKNCISIRINEFGNDEKVWYFIKDKNKIYSILIGDFM